MQFMHVICASLKSRQR